MENLKLKNIVIASMICLASPSLYAKDPINIQLIFGQYWNADEKVFPLLAASTDHGVSWSYPADIHSVSKLPADYFQGSFRSASCNDDFCVAAGSYWNNVGEGGDFPLIAVSKDHGASWSYVPTKPANYATGAASSTASTACNSSLCIVAMNSYKDKEGNDFPFLAVSKDKGASWVYPTTIISELPKNERFNISGVTCSESSCIIKGRSISRQLMAASTDQAATWAYHTFNLPSEYKRPAIDTVKCHDKVCLAAGHYDESENKLGVMVLRSIDKGVSWSLVKLEYKPLTNLADFGHINYVGDTWIISGLNKILLEDGYTTFRPLVYVSRDNGVTWLQPPTILSDLPARASVVAGDVSCVNNLCVLIMGVDTVSGFSISQDRGITWSYRDPSSLGLDVVGQLLKVSCDEKTCFALGEFKDKFNQSKPYIVLSADQGKTWYSPTTMLSNLPADYAGGQIFGGSDRLLDLQKAKKQFGMKAELERHLKKNK